MRYEFYVRGKHMPRFAANLSMLFNELPHLDRFGAAADAGFEAVEVLYPYQYAAKETQRALLRHGLKLVLVNAPPPNYTGGEPGFAAIASSNNRFQSDIRRVLRYNDVLQSSNIHIMAGITKAPEAHKIFVDNLKWAADFAPYQQFTIEPLNPTDQPGYFLDDYNLAADILDEVGRNNVKLQFNTYHAHLIHGDVLKVWDTFAKHIAHVQISSAPKRCEPSKGPIAFNALFEAIDNSDYTGWVGAEYTPTTKRTEDSLNWMSQLETV